MRWGNLRWNWDQIYLPKRYLLFFLLFHGMPRKSGDIQQHNAGPEVLVKAKRFLKGKWKKIKWKTLLEGKKMIASSSSLDVVAQAPVVIYLQTFKLITKMLNKIYSIFINSLHQIFQFLRKETSLSIEFLCAIHINAASIELEGQLVVYVCSSWFSVGNFLCTYFQCHLLNSLANVQVIVTWQSTITAKF